MGGTVTINLGKLDVIRAELAKGYYAKVGILTDTTHFNAKNKTASDGKTRRVADKGSPSTIGMVELGTIHEFGSISRNIPPRSFLRMPIEYKKADLIKFMTGKKFGELIENGEISKAMGLLGAKAEGIVKEAFESGGFGLWPTLKAETRKRKGSDAPLIDSGALRRSITSDVVKN